MLFSSWKKWFSDKDNHRHPGITGWLLYFARFGFHVGREFRLNLCLERAATLAFATVLSLIPLSVLFFSFAGLIKTDELIKAYVKEKIFPLVAPDFQADLSRWLEDDISKNHAFQDSLAGLVGFIALFSLIVAALGAALTAERNFNRIWKTKSARSYLQKFSVFWLILTLSPFVLVASHWVGDWLVPAGSVMERLAERWVIIEGLYGFVVPVSLGAVAFTVLYLFLPSARVRMGSAALGGIVAAVLWEASKRGFTLYMLRASSLYGQLGIVPLFLFWLYLTWLIILGGCVISYVHQNLPLLLELGKKKTLGLREVPLSFLGLFFLERIVRSFKDGADPPTVESVAEELGVGSEAVAEAGRLLVEGGILAETTEPARSYALRRDPESTSLREVVELLPHGELSEDLLPGVKTPHENGAAEATSGTVRAFQRAREAFLERLAAETLADLIASPGASPGPRSAGAHGRKEREKSRQP